MVLADRRSYSEGTHEIHGRSSWVPGEVGAIYPLLSFSKSNDSTNQYARRLKQWGFVKNTPEESWKYIAHQVQKRKLKGKESETYVKGILIPDEKLKREISRYDLPTFAKRRRLGEEISNDYF